MFLALLSTGSYYSGVIWRVYFAISLGHEPFRMLRDFDGEAKVGAVMRIGSGTLVVE